MTARLRRRSIADALSAMVEQAQKDKAHNDEAADPNGDIEEAQEE